MVTDLSFNICITRVKERDWYDFVWYVGSNSKLSLKHLENRMKQTGHLAQDDILSKGIFLDMLYKQVDNVEFEKAKNDVLPFLKDPGAVSVWSRNFFREVIKKIQYH